MWQAEPGIAASTSVVWMMSFFCFFCYIYYVKELNTMVCAVIGTYLTVQWSCDYHPEAAYFPITKCLIPLLPQGLVNANTFLNVLFINKNNISL